MAVKNRAGLKRSGHLTYSAPLRLRRSSPSEHSIPQQHLYVSINPTFEVMTAPQNQDFFGRYNRIILITFTLVSIVVGSLFYLQFQTNYQYNQQQLIGDFDDRFALLESVAQDAANRVTTVQTAAQGYLLNHPAPPKISSLPLSALRPYGNTSDSPDFYELGEIPRLPADWLGNLGGAGRVNDLNAGQKRDLALGFSLNSLFKAVTQEMPSVAWIYYISPSRLTNLYPKEEIDTLVFTDDYYDYDIYKLARSQYNPDRNVLWTSPYIDAAGKGLMVSLSAPVYENDDFHGIVGLDFTLNTLNDYVESLELRGRSQSNLFIIDNDNHLLAHPSLVHSDDTDVIDETLAFPESLRDHLTEINHLSPGQFHRVDDYWLIRQEIKSAPWSLVFWIPRRELQQITLASTDTLFLVLLPGLGIILAIATQLTRATFIRPSKLLVRHIQNERESETKVATPDNIPAAWEPWFEQISDNFDQSRTLYQQAQAYAKDLEQSQLKLIQSEKMSALGSLVSGVAHEINNPVGCILGNVGATQDYMTDLLELLDCYEEEFPEPGDVIQERLDDIDLEYVREDFPVLLKAMKDSGDRITAISRSLRIFSRKDTATQQLFDIHAGIDSTLLVLRHRLKANDKRPAIAIVKHYGDIPPISCFPGQLNQVFMNLLANAIEALDETSQGRSTEELKANPKQITLQTEVDQDSIKIDIADNGPGIPEAIQKKIFDQLFTTKEVGKGTGLGLAIAHRIVTEAHGGTLTVDSTAGQGTQFTIRLPL